jgi:ATP-dependent Clp protease ATP-binding subunit ClpC
MAEDLRGAVVGQEDAIGRVVKAIQSNRGLKDPKKLIGTFIFLGPTGVGKQNWRVHWHAICLIQTMR